MEGGERMNLRVLVEPNRSKDWPYHRVKILHGEHEIRLTPNKARRLIDYLETAIRKAEER